MFFVNIPELRKVSILYNFFRTTDASGAEKSLAFMFKVMELVAVKRISPRDATIFWYYQSQNGEDSVDSHVTDDGDDEDDIQDEHDGPEQDVNGDE